MDSKQYGNYTFLENGTVKRDGKLITSKQLYIGGMMHNVADILARLFVDKPIDKASTPKETVPAKLPHKLKGTIKSIETKQLMSKAKQKRIVFDGVEYPSIKECAKLLGVSRQTIHRRLKA